VAFKLLNLPGVWRRSGACL